MTPMFSDDPAVLPDANFHLIVLEKDIGLDVGDCSVPSAYIQDQTKVATDAEHLFKGTMRIKMVEFVSLEGEDEFITLKQVYDRAAKICSGAEVGS